MTVEYHSAPSEFDHLYSGDESTMNSDLTIKASRYAKLLWDEWVLQPVDCRYNLGFISQISGELDPLRLKNALCHFINQNPVIRSSFIEEDETLFQNIHSTIKDPVEYYDCSGNEQAEIDLLLRKLRGHSFTLTRAPLFKFALLKTGDSTWYLVLIFHHILIDGTSAQTIPGEISRYYEADSLDLSIVKTEIPRLHRYLEYEEVFFKQHSFAEDLEYWDTLLYQRDFYVHLPRKEHRPDESRFSAKSICFSLGEELSTKLHAFTSELGCTVFHVMSAVWSIFLRKNSNQDEISQLYAVSVRPRELRDLEGYLVNPLPMLVDFKGQSTLISTVRSIKEQRARSKSHQYLPFDQIVACYNKKSAVRYGKRFDNYLNATVVEADEIFNSPVTLKGLSCRGIPFPTLSNSELHMIYRVGRDSLEVQICYDEGLLDNSVFDRSGEHFTSLLEHLLASPDADIDSFTLFSDGEYRQIIHDWNRTESPWPGEKTIQALFEEQVEKTPENRAVFFEGAHLTYRELNEKANQLAHTIRREYRELCGEEIKGDSLIGLYIDRGMDMIVALLGILKSGAAYVPFDLADPEERLKFKINDCGCRMIITSSASLEDLVFLAETDTMPLSVDSYRSEIEKAPKDNPVSITKPEDLAYLIYTSGSTGKPKGVMTRQCGVVNFISYHREKFRTSRTFDNVIQSISINFDASWTELALSLFRGSALYIIRSIGHLSGDELALFMEEQKISIFISTPALISALPRKTVPGLECIISGGDVGDKSMMDYWSDKVQYYNAYGPTEATICATYSLHHRAKSNRNIGRPLQNKKAYILDGRLNPVPVGVYGELYIGGEGLARGYLHRPELTAERFIDNPFVTEEERGRGHNLKLYKTGDVVRWLPDGAIEFHERNDDQVKISGFRVELGEIEHRLAEYPSLSQCAVLCREHGGNKYLAAYVTAGEKIDAENLNTYLSKLLPYYMVPSFFIQLDEMPYTVNGKIDRRALPEPDFTGGEENYAAPRNETEEMLCRMWSNELGVEKVGISDDFFRLGGNSILAIKLSNRMTKALQREIPVASLFDLKTIQGISEGLARFTRQVTIEHCGNDEAVLSFAQERLYFIEEYEGGSSAYNIPLLYELERDTDVRALRKSIESIVRRQEILRTVFVRSEGGEVRQKVRTEPPEIREWDIPESDFRIKVAEDINVVFDLHREYPLRIIFYKTERSHYVLINIHHIAFDGWSVDIFLSELDSFYRYHRDGTALTVPDLEIQYRDFAAWQREYLSGERLKSELEYWRKALADCETFDFPVDRTRPAEVQYGGEYYTFELDSDLSHRLRKSVQEYGTTPYSLFLAAFYILLHKYSGQDDIILGTPTANRQYRQLENLVGFFVNSTVMRCTITPDLDIRGLIEHTAAAQAAMQMYQDLPFEKLIELLKVDKDPSRHPLFQIMFGLQSFGALQSSGKLSFLVPIDITEWYKVSKFDLSLMIDDSQDVITGSFNYATSLFEKARIAGLACHYQDILRSIASGENRPLREIPLLSPAECDTILHDWNETSSPCPRNKTIVELFEEQAERVPENAALIFGEETLTYRELNERANQLAHTMRRDYRELTGSGIAGDTLIGLYTERGIDMIVSILGILKSGAAYVPFDRADPQQRLRFKINDCGCRMILTSSPCISDLVFLTEKETLPISIDEYWQEIDKSPRSNPPHINTSRDLAYVIYTSGSTGTPKGVMIEQYGVVNLAHSHRKSFGIAEGSRILQFAPISFDASVSTLFCALLNGATLCLCSEETRKDVERLAEFIVDKKISLIDIPAKLLELLPKDLDRTSLRHIITAGEVCDLKTMEYWSDKVTLINAYGPTESTVCATYAVYSPGKGNTTIGKPISNKKVYVLDPGLNAVPIGVPGELHIGGDGLARCYLNHPEMTDLRFITNPFLHDREEGQWERRMYRTGDMVRWSKEGELEFIGRNDDQVKIHGYRIEPAEIEHKLSSFPGIAMCIVTVYRREQDSSLCAYYTVSGKVSADELRGHLATVLPDYMIPSYFVELAQFPLNSSGKIDRKSLPAPDTRGSEDTFAAPRNRSEEELCRLWSEILGRDRVGINDDFFKAGGNSILAIKLAHRMRAILGHEVAVSEIFKKRTISGFSPAGDQEAVETEGEEVEL
ncbi:MAG: amino acid adenylation domain-containing protein [Candidatus Xenobiia bacterium LiM19]